MTRPGGPGVAFYEISGLMPMGPMPPKLPNRLPTMCTKSLVALNQEIFQSIRPPSSNS